jgi:DNA-binding MarR family transcriptional regulator
MTTTTLRDAPEPVREDLPPSCKLTYLTLQAHDQLTQQELVEETTLSSRTVRYAVDRLEEADVVASEWSLKDARQRQYRIPAPNSDR